MQSDICKLALNNEHQNARPGSGYKMWETVSGNSAAYIDKHRKYRQKHMIQVVTMDPFTPDILTDKPS